MANKYFNTVIQKVPLGGIDLTELHLDMVTSDNLNFEESSLVSELSAYTVGIPQSIGLSVVGGVEGDLLVLPQSLGITFNITSDVVVQGIVTYDKNGNLISFLDFGNLREMATGDVFTLDLPQEIFRFRGQLI